MSISIFASARVMNVPAPDSALNEILVLEFAVGLNLAAELLGSVLVDLAGIDDVTATRWAQLARRDWQTYLAQRRIEQSPINSPE